MLILLVVVSCSLFANANKVPRIFNGMDAWIEQYPYQVAIESQGKHVCGGSIISKNYVLTAAHCADLVSDVKKLLIRAGTSFRGKGGSLHKVMEFISHKGYDVNNSFANDIAIIKVEEPFDYDDTRQPIELFKANEEVTSGVTCFVTGFGLVSQTKLADRLQAVDLTIVGKEDCKIYYKRNLPKGQICAKGINGKDSCTGDSGGPIVIDGRLAGIVSNGAECGNSRFASMYTEVAYYRDWIKKHAEF